MKVGETWVPMRLLTREEGLQLGLGASSRDDKGLMGSQFLKSCQQDQLIGPYNVTCMYVLGDDHLILDNKFVCSFLRETISPTLSIP